MHYLKRASARSAEACVKLGKLHLKGIEVPQDLGKAYCYLRTATLFRCLCGSFAEAYHSNRVSNAHVCYSTEAKRLLESFAPETVYEKQFRRKLRRWQRRAK